MYKNYRSPLRALNICTALNIYTGTIGMLFLATTTFGHPEEDCEKTDASRANSSVVSTQVNTGADLNDNNSSSPLTEVRKTGPSCYRFKEFDKDKIRVRRNGETSYFYRVKASIQTPMTLVLVDQRGELVELKEYTESTPADRDFHWKTSKGPLAHFHQNIEDHLTDLQFEACQ